MTLQIYRIASTTVGSTSSATIDFQNIPSGYTDLMLVISGRTDRVNVWAGCTIGFNNSTANFTCRNLEGGDSTVTSASSTSAPGFNLSGSTATANTFSNGSLYIPNYTSSNNKSFSIDSINESNQTTACYQTLVAGLWSQTAAINRITITGVAGNFVQNSLATLYGIL